MEAVAMVVVDMVAVDMAAVTLAGAVTLEAVTPVVCAAARISVVAVAVTSAPDREYRGRPEERAAIARLPPAMRREVLAAGTLASVPGPSTTR